MQIDYRRSSEQSQDLFVAHLVYEVTGYIEGGQDEGATVDLVLEVLDMAAEGAR